jgi:hypothetical protein
MNVNCHQREEFSARKASLEKIETFVREGIVRRI